MARGAPSGAAVRLCINCAGTQESDWAVGAVLVYAGELSALQMQQVEDHLSVLYGVQLERAQAGEHARTRVLSGLCAFVCMHTCVEGVAGPAQVAPATLMQGMMYCTITLACWGSDLEAQPMWRWCLLRLLLLS